jgi:hypothetical protein
MKIMTTIYTDLLRKPWEERVPSVVQVLHLLPPLPLPLHPIVWHVLPLHRNAFTLATTAAAIGGRGSRGIVLDDITLNITTVQRAGLGVGPSAVAAVSSSIVVAI